MEFAWGIPNVTFEWFKHSNELKSNVNLPLLLFLCLASFLLKKNERAYVVGSDGIKTDNWLKLFKLNCL